MSIKKKKFNIAKKILVDVLENTISFAGDFVDAFEYPSIAKDIHHHVYPKYIKREITRLKREAFLEERKRGDRLVLCLTDKGKRAALRQQAINCDDVLKNKYYVVIFDIPESERHVRRFFRMFLKESGFVQLQKSVWVTQKDILRPLVELIHAAKAEKWAHVITAITISDFSLEKNKNIQGKRC